MKVLLTGAFGNVGASTLGALLAQGHAVRCFDVPTRANRRAAQRWGSAAEVVWGDVRRPEDLAQAVLGVDAVIHLAFIIPKLSITGVGCEERPDFAREVNVGGTRSLITALEALPAPRPKLIFSSSLHVYGQTQDVPPPRTVSDPVQPIEHYSRHKVACEALVRASDLDAFIARFAAVLPLALRLDPGMFDVPLDNRMEFVHTRDVGLALANAVTCDAVWGRTLHIGGGARCQYVYREIVTAVLEAVGVGMLPEAAFGTTPFCTDWLDTDESQRLLRYQRLTLEDYVAEMAAMMGARRYLMRALRPLARWWLLRRSPYYRQARRGPGT
jgi:nucleoside-diphosphate-sugar epimerase